MANDSMLQVRIESRIKKEADELFSSMGITFADAVRIFAIQCINCQGFPFEVKSGLMQTKTLHAAGIAHKYADTSKIQFEKDAWALAMEEKHANS